MSSAIEVAGLTYLANCLHPPAHDRQLDDRCGSNAVELLRLAWKRGGASPPTWSAEPRLTSLRGRADFQQLVTEVSAKTR
jgi:hypothetical protein